jgi:glycosyltransferase involved in cell wall biosynthesis
LKIKKPLLDDPCKIYDCSNSIERPVHRGSGGPVMNDIMRYLHERAEDYYFKFIDSPEEAEVIITNDVFPKSILELGKPLVKRMCGPFWQNDMSYRNDILNASAKLADRVIFISEYSRKQYINCFGDNLNSRVVLNSVDDSVFYPVDIMPKNHDFTLVAQVTNWNRKEKRLTDLIKFAEINPRISFTILGTIEEKNLPSNMLCMGYLSDPNDIAYIFNSSDGFINPSYRDVTKTISQAINCGLPVLYADSGGCSEMVKNKGGCDFGIAISDHNTLDMEDEVPPLNLEAMQIALDKFRINFRQMQHELSQFDRKLSFRIMLDGYFGTICELLK